MQLHQLGDYKTILQQNLYDKGHFLLYEMVYLRNVCLAFDRKSLVGDTWHFEVAPKLWSSLPLGPQTDSIMFTVQTGAETIFVPFNIWSPSLYPIYFLFSMLLWKFFVLFNVVFFANFFSQKDFIFLKKLGNGSFFANVECIDVILLCPFNVFSCLECLDCGREKVG